MRVIVAGVAVAVAAVLVVWARASAANFRAVVDRGGRYEHQWG